MTAAECRAAILAHVAAHPRQTAAEIAARFGLTRGQALYDLRVMEADGRVAGAWDGRAVRWTCA